MKTNFRKNKTGIISIAAVIACAIVLVSTPAFATIVLKLQSDTTTGSTTFDDSSVSDHPVTAVCDAQHSTAQAKFGASSIYLDGTGDYLSIPDHSDWDIGTGSYTVDMWVMFDTVAVDQALWGHSQANQELIGAHWQVADSSLQWWDFRNGGPWPLSWSGGNWSPAVDTWYHIAFVKNGTSAKIYIDGTSLGAGCFYSGSARSSTGDFTVGKSSTRRLTGYIDDFYVRQGEALSQSDINLIVAAPNVLRNNLTAGLNTTFSMGYTTEEIQQIYRLYYDGKLGSNPADVMIDATTWRYYAALDEQSGKTIGQSYYNSDDLMHIYLGSGIAEVDAELVYVENAMAPLELSYSEAEMDQLVTLYDAGTAGGDPSDITIQGTTWHYYDTLPDEVGRSVGDAYTYAENKYIYMGSSGLGENISYVTEWDTITAAGSQFALAWDSNDLQMLLDLYNAGSGIIEVDGTRWEYYSDLPDQGDYNLGDAYEWNGRKFIFLGSGIGEAPELPTGIAPLAMMMFGIVMRFRNRRKNEN